MQARPLDPKALKILKDTFWEKGKWKRKSHTDPEDLRYAIEAGVMFHPRSLDHDARVEWVLKAVQRVDRAFVGRQFLASLSSRRLDRRSALGSYTYASHFPAHAFKPSRNHQTMCLICGDGELTTSTNLNLENFYRHHWGGFFHTKPLYAAFDLDQARWLDDCEPTPKDLSTMSAVLDAIANLPPEATPNDIVRNTAKLFPSNAWERRVLVNILGYAGILQTRDRPGWSERFVRFYETLAFPGTPRNDWPYPIVWWRRIEGINAKALARAFPGYDF